MLFDSLPDWRNIGWHLGKKLRDILGPPGDGGGPSAEERRAQRLLDARKGLVYFDTFDEVEGWSSAAVDGVQVANTPLQLRAEPSGMPGSGRPTSKVLLCHDFKGGYHDYESVRPGPVESEPYGCDYLQYVESFVYFSHKLVSMPPPSWTNLLHRNGVKALGTFIVEPQTPDVERMLAKRGGRYTLAHRLVEMAETYGFDGWLLNIEKEFPRNATADIVDFVGELKALLGTGRQVLWYDALTVENEVRYQNGLTAKNAEIAAAVDGLFTNYKWDEAKLRESREIALRYGIDLANVYFGIDVWAQNTDMPGPPRVTYPATGGGGTNTGLAIKTLAEHGFSAAVFAPAWSHEHFSSTVTGADAPSTALSVARSLWEGAELPSELAGCDCSKGKPHHSARYMEHPIVKHAVEYPAGTDSYFETDFSSPFVRVEGSDGTLPPSTAILASPASISPPPTCSPCIAAVIPALTGSKQIVPTLGAQAPRPCLQPAAERTTLAHRTVNAADDNPRGLSELVVYMSSSPAQPRYIPLYNLSMATHAPLAIRITYHRPRPTRALALGLRLTFTSPSTEPTTTTTTTTQHHPLPYKTPPRPTTHTILVAAPPSPRHRLTQLGIYCTTESNKPTTTTPLLHVQHLAILPHSALRSPPPDFRLHDARTTTTTGPGGDGTRLGWRWTGDRADWPAGLPWSATTGPFAYFEVEGAGAGGDGGGRRVLGRAYGVQFPLGEGEEVGEEGFTVRGVVFGGLELELKREG